MLGAIVGDTVGSIYEFNNTKDYIFEMFTVRSGYTDDSIMTMAVAYWLLKDPEHKYETLEEAMVMFAKNCSCPNGGYGEMFYIWLFMPWSLKEICPKAFDDDFFPKFDSPDGRVPYNSWGNGSAMRVSAVGAGKWMGFHHEDSINYCDLKWQWINGECVNLDHKYAKDGAES